MSGYLGVCKKKNLLLVPKYLLSPALSTSANASFSRMGFENIFTPIARHS